MDHLKDSTLTIHGVIQGTDAWRDARLGTITASIIGRLITPSTLAPANNDTSRATMAGLVAETITGRSEHFETWQMARGTEDESYARDLYRAYRAPVTEIGYVTRGWFDAGVVLGASPDGLVGDDGLIECKSRGPHLQVQHVAGGVVPRDVIPQIQAQLLVTGRQWCDYVSYCQGLALHVIRVDADLDYQAALFAAAETAYAEMGMMLARYIEAAADLPVAPIRPDDDEVTF
jgi:hypothetical protein